MARAFTLMKRFYLKFNLLTHEERFMEIFNINGQPYSWYPIWIEVQNNTKMSKDFLSYLYKGNKI